MNTRLVRLQIDLTGHSVIYTTHCYLEGGGNGEWPDDWREYFISEKLAEEYILNQSNGEAQLFDDPVMKDKKYYRLSGGFLFATIERTLLQGNTP